jgi:hypothetical protein
LAFPSYLLHPSVGNEPNALRELLEGWAK